ncbi:hypothetical protein E4T56_gene11092 [Termitomyces sp. T112]|nr:hypothetical protein E4T56_gene11092 [Termitomyces sp. T112]KAH0586878.1 hypothetical protein H2248_005718 [Termitomyces sp. 'cryptogamus']KAH0586879.1 hypothetical protein H2248_005718 [Termitomyces sp. 'cryptogamus']
MNQASARNPTSDVQLGQSSASPDTVVQLTIEDLQALLTTAQNAIIESTQATITATQADIQTYIKHELAGLETRLSAAEECLKRIPIQLSNSRMPFNSPLQYPPDVQIVKNMPILKRDIFNLLESDCIVTARTLKLPPLPGNPTVDQRRTQIGAFLGVI